MKLTRSKEGLGRISPYGFGRAGLKARPSGGSGRVFQRGEKSGLPADRVIIPKFLRPEPADSALELLIYSKQMG
jgi:hypothetical protein